MNAKKKEKKLYYRPLLNTKRQYINSRWVPNFSWWLAIKVLFNFSLNKMVGLMDLISSGRSFHGVPHTHPFNGLCPGLPGWAGTRKVKPIWILLKQETVGGSGISWTICKSASHSRQITTPAPTTQFFLLAGCPSCHPTNSFKSLKAIHRVPPWYLIDIQRTNKQIHMEMIISTCVISMEDTILGKVIWKCTWKFILMIVKFMN